MQASSEALKMYRTEQGRSLGIYCQIFWSFVKYAKVLFLKQGPVLFGCVMAVYESIQLLAQCVCLHVCAVSLP